MTPRLLISTIAYVAHLPPKTAGIWLGIMIGGMLPVLSQVNIPYAEGTMQVMTDTTAIGRPLGVKLTLKHPKRIMVLFPREKKDFAPFEAVRIEAEPTRIEDNVAIDEATIYLRTFELDSIQYISLPYGYVVGQDTIWQRTTQDSVRIRFRVQDGAGAQMMNFQGTTQPLALSDPPNYFLIGGGIVLGFGLLLGLISILQRPFQRLMVRRRLLTGYNQIEKQRKQVAHMRSPALKVEVLNDLWKSYLDPQGKLYLKSLTRTELEEALPKLTHLRENQRDTLRQLAAEGDKILFANLPADPQQLETYRQALGPILEVEYERRLAALKG